MTNFLINYATYCIEIPLNEYALIYGSKEQQEQYINIEKHKIL